MPLLSRMSPDMHFLNLLVQDESNPFKFKQKLMRTIDKRLMGILSKHSFSRPAETTRNRVYGAAEMARVQKPHSNAIGRYCPAPASMSVRCGSVAMDFGEETFSNI